MMDGRKGSIEIKCVETLGEEPGFRYRHSLQVIPHQNKMILIGGDAKRNDFYIFDLETNHWTRKSATLGLGYISSCLFSFPNRTVVILFGGMTAGYRFSGEVYEIDVTNTEDVNWKHIETQGKSGPRARWAHTSVQSPNGREMWIFGGWALGGYFNDLWKYDVMERKWEEIVQEDHHDCPSSRWNHDAVTIKSQNVMIVSGGAGSYKTLETPTRVIKYQKLRDVWKYCFIKNKWTEIATIENEQSVLRRSSHQMVLLHDPYGNETSKIIFGPGLYETAVTGEKLKVESFHSFWELDLDRNKWSLIPTNSKGQIYREYAMVQYKNRIYFHGGKIQTLSSKKKKPKNDHEVKKFSDDDEFEIQECLTKSVGNFTQLAYFDIPNHFFVVDMDMDERIEYLKGYLEEEEELSFRIVTDKNIFAMKILLY